MNEELMKRWKNLIRKLPDKNKFNTIPEGEITITFCGEPEEDPQQYSYDKGKNKGERHCIIIKAILHLSKDTVNKITEKEHPLGIARTAFQELFAFLKTNNLSFELKDRTFICKNLKNRKYEWSELQDKNLLSEINQASD